MTYLRAISVDRIEIARRSIDDCGFCEIDGALTEAGQARLLQEALAQFEDGCYSTSQSGTSYEAYLADFGADAASFVRSAEMGRLLHSLFGAPYRPATNKSCFTYYFGGGYLAPHLDTIPGTRAVSALTYLLVDGRAVDIDSGLGLDIYGRGCSEPGEHRQRFVTCSGSIVLGYGADVWHGRAPLKADEKVVMINGSYMRTLS